MADYKTLGQSNPAATTNTTLYTAGVQAIASTLSVTNTGAAAATFRVAVRPAGATLAIQHYVAYNEPLAAAPTNPGDPPGSNYYTLGLSFAATDVVTVYASTADVAFTLTGVENP